MVASEVRLSLTKSRPVEYIGDALCVWLDFPKEWSILVAEWFDKNVWCLKHVQSFPVWESK